MNLGGRDGSGVGSANTQRSTSNGFLTRRDLNGLGGGAFGDAFGEGGNGEVGTPGTEGSTQSHQFSSNSGINGTGHQGEGSDKDNRDPGGPSYFPAQASPGR